MPSEMAFTGAGAVSGWEWGLLRGQTSPGGKLVDSRLERAVDWYRGQTGRSSVFLALLCSPGLAPFFQRLQ